MDIKFVMDQNFKKTLNNCCKDFLKSLFKKYNNFDYEKIKDIFLNNNIETGLEGNVYYKVKNKNFAELASSAGNQYYIEALEEVKKNWNTSRIIKRSYYVYNVCFI